jgi:hypothetical protein
MTHPVTIWFSNEAVFTPVTEPYWSKQWRLNEEVREWLKDNTHGMGWGDKPIQEVTTGDIVGVEFRFVEPSHATLFKLTWGGAL